MKNWHTAVFLLLAAFFPWGITAPELLSQVPSGGRPPSTLRPLQQKQAIEHHFESLHPVARLQFGSAVPGAALIEIHRQRAAELKARMQAHASATAVSPASGAILPGLVTRPWLGAGTYPTSVVTGDFNNDGHLDFAVANGGDNNIWIYLGRGDGTFQLPRMVPLSKGLAPVYLVTADLQKRGILDLVVAENDTDTVGVLPGNGDGTFGFEQIYSLPQTPVAVTVNDFNHDGKPDIVAVMNSNFAPASSYPYIAMIAGNGNGTFASPVITQDPNLYSDAFTVDSADVNGDGLPDLLITGPNNLDNADIFLNNGDGTFRQGQVVVNSYPGINAPVDGRLADVNGDGCPDAVVADLAATVWVSLGDCAGNFSKPVGIAMGQSNSAVRIADVNGDGHPDIIASSEMFQESIYNNFHTNMGNTVSVALGDGKGNFSRVQVYEGNSEAESLAVGDFKSNGRPDIVTADIDTDTVSLFSNDGQGGFGFPQGVDACRTYQSAPLCPFGGMAFADLNGDGKQDIYTLSFINDYYSLAFLNDGAGHLSASIASVFGTNTSLSDLGDFRLGDFRNTGHQDLVAIGTDVYTTSGKQVILFQPGNGDGTFGGATSVTTTGADGKMATGDFNGDGKLDFVAANGGPQAHTLTAFLGNGDGTFRAATPIAFSDNNETVESVYAGDFNRDGKTDVIVSTGSNSPVPSGPSTWEFDGNGDGTFQPGRVLFSGVVPTTFADINNDGHADIVAYGPTAPYPAITNGQFTNYLGQPDGTFQQVSSYAPYAGIAGGFSGAEGPPADPTAGDYNGDGKIDEAASEHGISGGNYVQFLLGNGDGTFVPTYDEFPFTTYVIPGWAHDLNGDGLTDMVSYDEAVGTFMIQPGGPAPALQMALATPDVNGNQGCGAVFPDIPSSSAETVTLSSSVTGVLLPASVTIPADATSADFCYTLGTNYDWHQVYDINATLNGSTATAYGSQVYTLGFGESLSTAATTPVYPGQTTEPETVTLTAQPGYSGTVSLSCDGLPSGFGCQFSQSKLSIAAGTPESATLQITTPTDGNTESSTITVVADDGNIIHRQALTVSVVTLAITGYSNTVNATSPGSGSEIFEIRGIAPYNLSCSGLPTGASCSFSGKETTYPPTSTSTDSVAVETGIAPGNYPFQVTVSADGYTASAAAMLGIFSYSIAAPATDLDWAPPNSNATITFPVQSSNLPQGSLTIGCTLDARTTCQTLIEPLNANATSVFQTLTVPADFSLGQHQLNLTTQFAGVSQNYTFPFYVADFSGALSSSALTVKAGASSFVTVTLNATTGFSDNVTLTCNNPAGVTCTFNPASVHLTSAGSQSVTLTLNSTAQAALNSRTGIVKSLIHGSDPLILAVIFPLGLGVSLRRRKWKRMLGALVCLFSLSLLGSCGSGSGSGNGGGSGAGGGSSSNTYTVSVSANASGTSDAHVLGSISVTVNN